MSLTICSQTTSIVGDSICLGKEDWKIIIEDLLVGEVCDSLIKQQSLVIQRGDSIINHCENRFKTVNELNDFYKSERDKSILKLKISKRLTILGVPAALIVGVIFGFSVG